MASLFIYFPEAFSLIVEGILVKKAILFNYLCSPVTLSCDRIMPKGRCKSNLEVQRWMAQNGFKLGEFVLHLCIFFLVRAIVKISENLDFLERKQVATYMFHRFHQGSKIMQIIVQSFKYGVLINV